ncbi:MAG: YggS family pyridoxal phosphate-dependent enzyme [Candidatus Zixiibacteriota bacterium]
MKNVIARNAVKVHGQIADICEKHRRKVDEITVVAVTKGFPTTFIRQAVAAGFLNIGENRIQDAEPKILELGPIATYHMVGHLQSNKAKKTVQLFQVIQSVDSFSLAEEINKYAQAERREIECLVQVNSSGESQKSGVAPDLCLDLIKKIKGLSHINLTGLMTIGPLTDDEKTILAAFKLCRDLFGQARKFMGNDFKHLSMGMSDDFRLAIAEGSTMIRLGTAIFGPRPAQ